MHDFLGRKLTVGDTVLIPAVVTKLHGGEDYCNVDAESFLPRRPDDASEKFCAVNTGVMLRANDLLDMLGFVDVDDESDDESGDGATAE